MRSKYTTSSLYYQEIYWNFIRIIGEAAMHHIEDLERP